MDHHTMAVFPSFSINCFVPFSPWLSYGCNMLPSLPVYKCLQYFTIHIKYININFNIYQYMFYCSTVLLFCHDFPWSSHRFGRWRRGVEAHRPWHWTRRGNDGHALGRKPSAWTVWTCLNDFGGFLADECRKHWKHWKHWNFCWRFGKIISELRVAEVLEMSSSLLDPTMVYHREHTPGTKHWDLHPKSKTSRQTWEEEGLVHGPKTYIANDWHAIPFAKRSRSQHARRPMQQQQPLVRQRNGSFAGSDGMCLKCLSEQSSETCVIQK